MTTMRTKLAQALPFAHLLGLGARAENDGTVRRGSRAEDDERDEDDNKGKRAEGDDKDEKTDARRAEDDDKEERAEDDEKDEKEARRAKKAEDEVLDDEDDSDEEMRGTSASAKARRRERARCAAIFGCAAAGARPDIAASLAFTTTMSRKEAVSVLQTAAAGAAPRRQASLAERMAEAAPPNVTGDGGASNPSGRSKVANAIIAAGEKARGK